MAHSYIKYRNKSVQLHDQLLTIVVLVGVDLIQHSRGWENLRRRIERWPDAVLDGPPGLIDIELSGYWETAEGAELLSRWLNAIEDKIRDFGVAVPGSFLNGLATAPTIRFVDTDVSLVISEIEKWKALIVS